MYSLRPILEVGGQEGHNVQSEGHTGGRWTGGS